MADRKIRVLAWPDKGINPYNELLYTEVRKQGVTVDGYTHKKAFTEKFDILHCHWPEYVLYDNWFPGALGRLSLLFLRFFFYRLKGVKIVWTAHDFAPHECRHNSLLRFYRRWFPKLVDGVFYLSERTLEPLKENFPLDSKTHLKLARHGDYLAAYPHSAEKAQCRRLLKIDDDAEVFCFCGLIRPYKNVPLLMREFRKIENPKAALVIAGCPSPADQWPELESLSRADARVKTDFSYIKEEDMQRYVRAGDLVVLPFRRIYNSGSALLALSMGRPVLLPDIPVFQELQGLVGKEWIRLFRGDVNVKQLLEGLEWARSVSRPDYPDFSAISWEKAAQAHVELYNEVLAK
jgi:beta-1,4-mannosyltransferase